MAPLAAKPGFYRLSDIVEILWLAPCRVLWFLWRFFFFLSVLISWKKCVYKYHTELVRGGGGGFVRRNRTVTRQRRFLFKWNKHSLFTWFRCKYLNVRFPFTWLTKKRKKNLIWGWRLEEDKSWLGCIKYENEAVGPLKHKTDSWWHHKVDFCLRLWKNTQRELAVIFLGLSFKSPLNPSGCENWNFWHADALPVNLTVVSVEHFSECVVH